MVALAIVSACGDEGSAGDARVAQAREAALDAGLPADVADFIGNLARAADATYQASYPDGTGGNIVVVSSDPPRVRVDVVNGVDIDRSQIRLDDRAYACGRTETGAGEPGPLSCERTAIDVVVPTEFSTAAMGALTDSLAERADAYRFDLVTREVAGMTADCLRIARRAEADDTVGGPGGEICANDDGVVLAATEGDTTFEVTDYGPAVPDGAFDLPEGG